MLISHCCVTNYSNVEAYTIYYLIDFVNHGLGRCLWIKVSHEVTITPPARTVGQEGIHFQVSSHVY